MKKAVVMLLVVALLAAVLGFTPVRAAGGVVVQMTIGSTKATINFKAVVLDQPPIIENGRTLVPFRFIGEALGAKIGWDPVKKTVSYVLGDKNIVLTIGSITAMVNGVETTLDVAPKILPTGRTVVPVRFISETIGAKVDWNSSTRIVTITMAATLDVGIVLPTKDEPRWIQDETRFNDALKTAGYSAEILFSQGSSAKEKENVEALITKGVKVLILCPQDATAAAASADEARAAGIKVISYDRLIRDTKAVDYYVTFDSIAVGKAQAQYLVDKATGTKNPLYLYAGAATDNNAFLFFEGAWDVLQPKIADGTFVIKNSSQAVALQGKATLTRDEMGKIIGQVTTNWDFTIAKNLAEANLTIAKAADKGNVFILAPNDGTARSIADAFGDDKDVKSYVITGQDAEIPSVQYIIDGKQSMTVLKDVRTLVRDAIAAAVDYLTGKTPEQTTTYNNGKIGVPAKPSVVVTVDKSNVKAALIDSGYYKASEFTGLP
ncbi:sugar ABC transporter substrate-binding protein [Candidatus Cryosericum septentrionale]|jgi:putative multiple sugar transport system substrate-binding protein|uniref:Sugar ABC transporter substrate-binding protein n=2 Tax=Candidatus Cryosericum septentrionale TaxID=2290913 RepID=A0A398DND0_9BACT|nr:substrate-binding domain-containing protein [Candidatus Cryosericum septentrionale]RIE17132.1 sugar ABC transporter substrate-binding protein [Candidatus Cryosericum septentrionale]